MVTASVIGNDTLCFRPRDHASPAGVTGLLVHKILDLRCSRQSPELLKSQNLTYKMGFTRVIVLKSEAVHVKCLALCPTK